MKSVLIKGFAVTLMIVTLIGCGNSAKEISKLPTEKDFGTIQNNNYENKSFGVSAKGLTCTSYHEQIAFEMDNIDHDTRNCKTFMDFIDVLNSCTDVSLSYDDGSSLYITYGKGEAKSYYDDFLDNMSNFKELTIDEHSIKTINDSHFYYVKIIYHYDQYEFSMIDESYYIDLDNGFYLSITLKSGKLYNNDDAKYDSLEDINKFNIK